MERNITKADMVDSIARATGITKVDTKAVLEGMITTIINAVSRGDKVEIRGFGIFNSKKRKARLARNPKNGKLISLNERYIPLFKPSNDFTKKVNAVRFPNQNANNTTKNNNDF